MAENPTQNPQTLVEARMILLENSNELANLREKISSLTAQNEEKGQEIETLRTLNQQLFLRVSQGEPEPEKEPEKVQSLEDFAMNYFKGVNNR